MKNIRKLSFISPLLITGAINIAAQEKPNILIIHTDEQNFRTLGCYRQYLSEDQAFPWGKEVAVETPNIDAMASNGVLFMRCYATTPVSSPSRGSFLSGYFPQNNGVLTNDMILNVPTFADILREHGYDTGYIGKLHLNGKGRPEWHPHKDYGFNDNRFMYNRGHWKKIIETENGPEFITKADMSETDSTNFPTDYLTGKAIDYIQRHKDTTFCCVLSLPDPHSANLVRSPYDTMYKHFTFQQPRTAQKDTTNLPAWSHGANLPQDRMEDMAQYFGMIKCIDDNIGKLIQTLSDSGILEKTIVIFTSDHGDMCGEHGLINKGVPLDGSSRVPFVVRYPKGVKINHKIDHVMSVVDFTPSILSFCGIHSPAKLEGRDLSPLWKGENLPKQAEDIVFMRSTTQVIKGDWDDPATSNRSLWISAVTPDYKLTYSENEQDVPWLTDLKKDPDELINHYRDPAYRKVVSELASQLNKYGEKYNDPRIKHPKTQQEIQSAILNK